MSSYNNPKEHYYNQLLERKSKTAEHKYYSQKRLDLLIISLSMAGIITVVNIIYRAHLYMGLIDRVIIGACVGGFVVAIFCNLFGQRYAVKGHSKLEEIDSEIITSLVYYEDEEAYKAPKELTNQIKKYFQRMKLLDSISFWTVIICFTILLVIMVVLIAKYPYPCS